MNYTVRSMIFEIALHLEKRHLDALVQLRQDDLDTYKQALAIVSGAIEDAKRDLLRLSGHNYEDRNKEHGA